MKVFFITLLSILLIILLLCIYFWPYFIAIKKQKDEHLAIFIVCLIMPAIPIIGWVITLAWAISLPDYRSEEEKEQQKNARNALWDFIVKHWISTLLFSITASLLITFGIVTEPWYKESLEPQIIEKAVNKYQKEQIKERAKDFGVSKKCAESYIKELEYEGYIEGDLATCSTTENLSIKNYFKKLSSQSIGNYTDPLYSDNGIPRSLVLKGVSINCFEKANLGNNNKCSKNELKIIKKFFEENKNINWQKEYFAY